MTKTLDTLDTATGGLAARPGVAEETAKDFLVSAALHQMDRVRCFIETSGLHPDTTYGGKPTALCYTVLKPHHELMTYLLERGADVNRQDGMGMTPLHYAALGGCVYCLSSLIGRGAKLNVENRLGETPLSLTLGRPQLAQNRTLCAEFLRRHGATHCQAAPGATQFH